MTLWQSLEGMIQVDITSADLEKTLEEISCLGIVMFDMEQRDLLTAVFRVRRTDLGSLRVYCEKKGISVKPIHKQGLFWYLPWAAGRPVLVCGLLLLFLGAALLPTRVYFFQVEGNSRLPDNRILEAAESCGIRFGVSRKSIRSEKMKNALLAALPELQWAGINTYGCRGVISVRERKQEEVTEETVGTGGIVAARDGVITSCTVTRGNGVCQVGQTVKQGQLLISPYVDCGLLIKEVVPEGEVFAHTSRKLQMVTPAFHTDVRQTKAVRRYFSLILGKKRINFRKGSGISAATCGRMYAEYYITLPGGFRLPVCLAVETITSRTGSEKEISQSDAAALLQAFSEDYIASQMIAGTVLAQDTALTREDALWSQESGFVCNEMIARPGADRNGEWNE